MILCIGQSLPKLLDCEVKNQVKHMRSFKNHIHKNASQFEGVGNKKDSFSAFVVTRQRASTPKEKIRCPYEKGMSRQIIFPFLKKYNTH